jgi:RimJ/RimL family protein N-acetyltransferase
MGRGYATETVRAMVDFIFERFQCAEITADHFNDNPASRRVLEKAGFKVTGQGEATSKARAAAAPNTLYALKRPDLAKGQRSKLGGDPQNI